MKLLHVDSSILGPRSASRQLTAAIVASLKKADSAIEVDYHDLVAEPLEHLTGVEYMLLAGGEPPDDVVRQKTVRNAKVLDRFLAANVVVVGSPMYNFNVSTNLKTWIDRLGVPGKTFRYTESGAEGLLKGKQIIVASSRGGIYTGDSPAAFLDHQESYLAGMFGFMGITDVRFIRAEGLQVSPELRKAAMDAALAEIAYRFAS